MTDSLDFWNIVSEPADPTELKVGDAVNVEWGKQRMVKIITEKWTDDAGHQKISIRDVRDDDVYDPPAITVIAKGQGQ